MDRTFAKHLIKELKAETPIPPETCPLLDAAIAKATRFMGVNEAKHFIGLLEQVREHNRTLRDLGREWYQLADDLTNQFPVKEGKGK